MKQPKQPCTACGALVPAVCVAPYRGHKKGCAFVQEWRGADRLGAAIEQISTEVVEAITAGLEAAAEVVEVIEAAVVAVEAAVPQVAAPPPPLLTSPRRRCRKQPPQVVDRLPEAPDIIDRTLEYDEVDKYRHIHCDRYDRCLDAVLPVTGKTQRSWACPSTCVGRQTFVEFPPILLQ